MRQAAQTPDAYQDPKQAIAAVELAQNERDTLAPWQERLEVVRVSAEEIRHASLAVQEQFLGANTAHHDLEGAIAKRWPQPERLPAGGAEWAARQEALAKLEALTQRKTALALRREDRSERWKRLARLLGRCEAWLEQHRRAILGGTLPPADSPEVLALTGGDPTKARLEGLRAKIAGNKASWEDIHRRPATQAERKAAIEAAVDATGRAYAERALGVLIHARAPADVDLALAIPTYDQHLIRGALCLFANGELKAKLIAASNAAVPPDLEPMSGKEQAQRLAALAGELRNLERAEELLIRGLSVQGIDVDRRGDADPAAVLTP